MWIPYFLFEFWEPDTAIATTAASEADQEEREFEIWFGLENPPTRRQEVEIQLREAIERRQEDGEGRVTTIRFQPNAGALLERVGYKIRDASAKRAFLYCYDNLHRLLSYWALSCGSGFSVRAVIIADAKHNARWKVLPQRAAPEEFAIPAEMRLSEHHAAVVSLYREARNAQSPFYRLLCCYKILEAWYRGGGIFAEADRLIRDRGLDLRRPRKRIDRDLLVTALVFNAHPEFEGLTFSEFFDRLGPWRARVAHALTDAGDFTNFDSYATQVELGPLANLVDLVAREILLDEFRLWSQIRERTGDAERAG